MKIIKGCITFFIAIIVFSTLYSCINKDRNYEYKGEVITTKNITTNVEETQIKVDDITLSDGQYISGKDLTPGYYNVIATKGDGVVECKSFIEMMGTNSEDYIKEYKNACIPIDSEIKVSGGLTIKLVYVGSKR